MAVDIKRSGKPSGGVTIIDPNKEGTNIKHEDLMVYVKLLARTKSRSILEFEDESITQLEQELKNVPNETNYTYPAGKQMLTTDWTDIGGSKLNGKDVGGFGITSIDIDIKSSFVPQVTVNFVDIRGATLFEQGPCSPYASFFHMPYPVFELTVKGFYGRAVTYSLALRQFTTKFNPSTGNFEVKGEFIGYTYAFLADLVMGYGLAAPYMPGAGDKFKDVWLKTLQSIGTVSAFDLEPLPPEPITLRDLLQDISNLELKLGELSNSDEFQEVGKYNILKTKAENLGDVLNQFIADVEAKNVGAILKPSKYDQDNTLLAIPKAGNDSTKMVEVRDLVKLYFGNNGDLSGVYGEQVNTINGSIDELLPNSGLSKITKVNNSSVTEQAGLYIGTSTKTAKELKIVEGGIGETAEFYYIDLGECFIKHKNSFIVQIDTKLDALNNDLTDIVNQAVKLELGYVPTIRNITAIILANLELFLRLLVDASVAAENHHILKDKIPLKGVENLKGKQDTSKVYPWPTYYESDSSGKKSGGVGASVEKYPGENPELRRWEEVKFVENFIKAYIELQEDLLLITGDVEGIRGFDMFLPLNPIESRLMDGAGGPYPNAYYKDENLNQTFKNIGERAFLVGDYTNMNCLTAWKTRFGSGIDNTNPIGPQVNLFPYRDNGFGIVKTIDADMMEKYGELDGINCANSLTNDVLLSLLQSEVTATDAANIVYDKVKAQLGSGLKEQKLSEWAVTNAPGVSIPSLLTAINAAATVNISDLSSDTTILSYGGITLGDDLNKTSALPKTNDPNGNLFVILDDGDPVLDASTSLDGIIQTRASSQDSVYNSSNTGFRQGLAGEDNWYKSVLGNGEQTSDGKSVFSLDDKAKIPYVNETFGKPYFIKREDWTYKWAGTGLGNWGSYTLGTISEAYGNGGFGPCTFYPPYWPEGNNGFGPPIFGTPWWQHNHKQQPYKVDKIFDVSYTPTTNGITGPHTDSEARKALAYITLVNMCYADSETSDHDTGEGYCGWYDIPGNYDTDYDTLTCTPFFTVTGSKVRVPKGFTYLTGAILWRMKEAGYFPDLPSTNGSVDPVVWPSVLTNGGTGTGGYKYRKLQPYHWPHIIDEDGVVKSNSFLFTTTDSGWDYVDIRKKMKSLFFLSTNIKEVFIQKFIDWAEPSGGEWDDHLKGVDPINWGGSNSIRDGWGANNAGYDYINPLNGVEGPDDDPDNGYGGPDNERVHNLYTDLFDSYHTIVYSTPRSFYGIDKDDFSDNFNIRAWELKRFVKGWVKGYEAGVSERITNRATGQEANELQGDRAMDDPDMKLSLYKSFKSLFDKWISRSDSAGGVYKMFYNRVQGNGEERSLIDHFQFVNRAFNDIGDKAIVDITYLKTLAEDPTQSLYQTITELLSKNNFDFFPLPGFINYSKSNDEELKDLFRPVTDLTNINSSPSFVCMYVGGTSKALDIGPTGQAFCGKNNEILFRYENDGIKDIRKPENVPEDFNDGDITAFIVSYGIENQSHFKSVNLNQAEFKETQESLMVIDQLSKGGNENNRVAKGQNLYNVYQTRSYTCEVEAMGNMMIQPMMYFHLENVPMFWGAYLITEVKHNIKPHYVTTTFKGTRVPQIIIPLVTDTYSTMVLSKTDPKKGTGPANKIIDGLDTSGYGSGNSNVGSINSAAVVNGQEAITGPNKLFIQNSKGLTYVYDKSNGVAGVTLRKFMSDLNSYLNQKHPEKNIKLSSNGVTRDLEATVAGGKARSKTSKHGMGFAIDMIFKGIYNGVELGNPYDSPCVCKGCSGKRGSTVNPSPNCYSYPAGNTTVTADKEVMNSIRTFIDTNQTWKDVIRWGADFSDSNKYGLNFTVRLNEMHHFEIKDGIMANYVPDDAKKMLQELGLPIPNKQSDLAEIYLWPFNASKVSKDKVVSDNAADDTKGDGTDYNEGVNT